MILSIIPFLTRSGLSAQARPWLAVYHSIKRVFLGGKENQQQEKNQGRRRDEDNQRPGEPQPQNQPQARGGHNVPAQEGNGVKYQG